MKSLNTILLLWALMMGTIAFSQGGVRGPFNKQEFELPDTGDVRVVAFPENASGYFWNMGGWKTPVIFVKDTGWVWVEVMLNDRSIIDSVHFFRCVNIGDSFLPNRESYNNCLPIVVNCELRKFEFTIFNRWGAKMVSFEDPKACWDGNNNGQELPEGTYFYIVEWINMQGEQHMIHGNIALLR